MAKKERMQTNEITLIDVRLNELVTTGLVAFSQCLVAITVKDTLGWLTRSASKEPEGKPLPAM
jgi:hypothetical protein